MSAPTTTSSPTPAPAGRDALLTQAFKLPPARTGVIVSGSMALIMMAGTVACAPIETQPHRVEDSRGSTPTGGYGWLPGRQPTVASQQEMAADSIAEAVRELHALSGLTWDQLAKLFGVSRRAVHHWASGGKLNAHNSALLTELTRRFRALPATAPDDRRSQILAPQEDGYSIFDQLRARHASGSGDVVRPPFTPAQLLGAAHDE